MGQSQEFLESLGIVLQGGFPSRKAVNQGAQRVFQDLHRTSTRPTLFRHSRDLVRYENDEDVVTRIRDAGLCGTVVPTHHHQAHVGQQATAQSSASGVLKRSLFCLHLLREKDSDKHTLMTQRLARAVSSLMQMPRAAMFGQAQPWHRPKPSLLAEHPSLRCVLWS